MTEQIGPLSARIRFESPVRNADEIGGASIVWNDEGEAWARIDAGATSSGQAYDTVRASGRVRVEVRKRDDLRPGWRVLWDGRILSIFGIEDGGGARITLACEEEVL